MPTAQSTSFAILIIIYQICNIHSQLNCLHPIMAYKGFIYVASFCNPGVNWYDARSYCQSKFNTDFFE